MGIEDLMFDREKVAEIIGKAVREQIRVKGRGGKINYTGLVNIAKKAGIDEKYVRQVISGRECPRCGGAYDKNLRFCPTDGYDLMGVPVLS